ncbi:MAG TPA: hypothetical protein VER96_35970 [Polyangiaceae bacterium]|nr:hypothetical protein [Polyangiaceae bacterium]
MQLLDARALFALFAGSFVVATACGSDRQFGARSAGGAAGAAGDRASNGGSSHGGSKPSSSGEAGADFAGAAGADAGEGGESGSGGEAGAETSNGGNGAGGQPATPECGALGGPCCEPGTCKTTNATCSAAACACSPSYSACGVSCVNLKTDPKNCGVCGHSCLGGTCDLGSCQPTTVATGQLRLSRMATDGNYLYWSGAAASGTPYYVARVRVDGTGGVKVLAATEDGAGALAVTTDKVYWISKGQLRSCDIPDCAAGPSNAITTATANGVSGDMLYEPGKKALYWSRGATYNTKDGTLYTLASGASTPTVVGTNPSNPGALVSDASNVYWINSSTYTTDNWNADGGLWRVRLSDGTVTQLAASMKGDISYLAISGATLYFAGNIAVPNSNPLTTTTAILSAPLPNGLGTGMQPQFAPAKNVRGMEADSKYLYFADESGSQGTISRCPAAACPTPETIVPGLYSPYLGAQDAAAIYFAASSASAVTSYTIQRLAK